MVNIEEVNQQIAQARLAYLEAQYPEAKRGAVAFYMHEDGRRVLGVTRGTDVENVNLPGGKVEEGETDHQACSRELYEETGCEGHPAALMYARMEGDAICVTFEIPRLSSVPEQWVVTNEGTPGWFTRKEMLGAKCSFREYNSELFRWKMDGLPLHPTRGLGDHYEIWLALAEGLTAEQIQYVQQQEGPAEIAQELVALSHKAGRSLVDTIRVLDAVYELETVRIRANSWLSAVAYGATT